jgi:hypothetical protein
MTKQNYNFGEKVVEKIKDGNEWVELAVWQDPKFKQSREKAIQLIEKDYGLDEGDFWILKNKSFKGMTYSGLIISHNGCLKINDKLEKPQISLNEFFVKYYDEYKTQDEKLAYYYKIREKLIYFGMIFGVVGIIYYLYDK